MIGRKPVEIKSTMSNLPPPRRKLSLTLRLSTSGLIGGENHRMVHIHLTSMDTR